MTHQFTFKTWADTRSNRRDRTYTVAADTYLDAHDLAVDQARMATRSRSTIIAELTDVDGHGIPDDCGHLTYSPAGVCTSGWAGYRWDGARLCADCQQETVDTHDR